MIDGLTFLADIPAAQARVRGEEVALACEGRTVTYAALDRASTEAAHTLVAMGVAPGDRIAWLGRSTEVYFEIFFGVAKARACLAPLNSRLAPPEMAAILSDNGAGLLFVTAPFFGTARTLAATVERPIRLIAVGGEFDGFESYAGLKAAAPPAPLAPPEAEDDVMQLYTSGTTGLPKGVRLNNANYAYWLGAREQMEGWDYGPGQTVLNVMPLFHVAGTNLSFSALAGGSRLVLLPEFDRVEALRLIAAEKVAHAFLVPAMINMLLQTPEIASTDMSSLEGVSYGASPITEAVLAQAKSRFGCGFVQLYGMTESTGVGTYLAADDHHGELLRSCGRPWPGVEVQIQDAEGREAAVGAIGEIAIRGPAVTAGYWNRPDATAEAITGEGWLRTGDAGYRDAGGYFFIHDRVKDMIVSGGENVYPAEVENAILGCPGVADAAVIGVPDEVWGEAVKAIVVASPDCRPDPQAIIAWARQRIAGFKTPKSVDFVESLPRNPSGKLLRRELRKPYWGDRARMV